MAKNFKLDKSQIKQLIPNMGACFATDRIMVDGRPVGYMYREVPDEEVDSGWRFQAGDESAEYMNKAANAGLYEVNCVCNFDPDIIPFLDAPSGTSFERNPRTKSFFEVGFGPGDGDAIMDDEKFAGFVDRCYEEFERKQEELNNQGLGLFPRYWYDQATRKLQFFDGDELKAEFSFVVVGTWAHQKNDWLWGWANESFLDPVRKDAASLKQLARITGRNFAIRRHLEADETKAYELTAVGVHMLSAKGMYRVPGEKNHMFLAIF